MSSHVMYKRIFVVSRYGTGRKKRTEQDAEGTGVNQNQLMSLSAVRRLLLEGLLHFKLIILFENRTSYNCSPIRMISNLITNICEMFS